MKERKAGRGSIARALFAGKSLLTERPEGMTYEEYKAARTHQDKLRKILFKKPSNQKILHAMGVRVGYNFHPVIIPQNVNSGKATNNSGKGVSKEVASTTNPGTGEITLQGES